jgi:F420-dependent oxidoreductase-like protein
VTGEERIGVSFSLDQTADTSSTIEDVRLAEQLGFHSVWIPEAWGRDAFTLLAIIALETETIQLATGIINVFSRTPALVAQSIASLDDISGGRAILGLGASGPTVIEKWHGLRFERILQRTREYIDVIRIIIEGSRADYNGEIFKLSGFRLQFRPPRNRIPIYLAAMGPANVRLAGEIADGWLPIFASRPFLETAGEWLAEGQSRADEQNTPVDAAAYIPALLGKGADDLLRKHLAFYIGGMGSFYFRLMVRSGFRSEAESIREAWQRGDRRAASQLVTDPVLDATTIRGSADEAQAKVREFRAMGVRLPILTMPRGATSAGVRATLEALGNGS